jgi:hypothetical protein
MKKKVSENKETLNWLIRLTVQKLKIGVEIKNKIMLPVKARTFRRAHTTTICANLRLLVLPISFSKSNKNWPPLCSVFTLRWQTIAHIAWHNPKTDRMLVWRLLPLQCHYRLAICIWLNVLPSIHHPHRATVAPICGKLPFLSWSSKLRFVA